jgi:hypothetical protein
MNRRDFMSAVALTMASGAMRGQMRPLVAAGQSYAPLQFPIVGGTAEVNPFFNLGFMKSGAPLIFDWGDGSVPSVVNCNSFNRPSHNYPNAALYILTVSSPDGWSGVTQFVPSEGNGSGTSPYTGTHTSPNEVSMPGFQFLTGLQYVLSADTYWYGNFPHSDLSIFQALQHVDLQGNNYSGNPPLLTSLPNLLYVDFHVAFGQPLVGVPYPSVAGCPLLQYMEGHGSYFSNCPDTSNNPDLYWFSFAAGAFQNVTGPMPNSFQYNPLLQTFNISSSGFTGAIANFAPCTALTSWVCNGNSLSGYTTGSFATQPNLATLTITAVQLTVTAVNAILADLVTSLSLPGRVGCTVDLRYGSNAAPTGAGVTNKAILNATSGWTVTTN